MAGSAVVALCAHIALPLSLTPVPMTLQPLAVLVLGLLLAPELAAATLALYLACLLYTSVVCGHFGGSAKGIRMNRR